MPHVQALPLIHMTLGHIPNVNDDETKGFEINSLVYHDTSVYKCTDASEGAAVWVKSGSGDFLPRDGSLPMTGNLEFEAGNKFIGYDATNGFSFDDTTKSLNASDEQYSASVSSIANEGSLDKAAIDLSISDSVDPTKNRRIYAALNSEILVEGDVLVYDSDRTTEIDENPRALIDRGYLDSHYSQITEITDSAKKTALQLNSNYDNPTYPHDGSGADGYIDYYYPFYTGTAITGQNEGDYFIGTDSYTGDIIQVTYKKVNTVLTFVKQKI